MRVNYNGSVSLHRRTVIWEDNVVTDPVQWVEAFRESYLNSSPTATVPSLFNNYMPYSNAWFEELKRRRADPTMDNYSIDANGKITCTNKDTGDPVVVGYLALANVDNPNGLLHTDGPYYTASDAAGDITLSAPNSAVTGYLNNSKIQDGNNNTDPDTMLSAKSSTGIMTSYLEGSGTDLATEFSNMIVYQRGYQANTRIISVTDSMLEELVNIKR